MHFYYTVFVLVRINISIVVFALCQHHGRTKVFAVLQPDYMGSIIAAIDCIRHLS